MLIQKDDLRYTLLKITMFKRIVIPPVKQLLCTSVRKHVQHFDCLTANVGLKLLKKKTVDG